MDPMEAILFDLEIFRVTQERYPDPNLQRRATVTGSSNDEMEEIRRQFREADAFARQG